MPHAKRLLSSARTRALISGIVSMVVSGIVCAVLISTGPVVWAQRVDPEYPTHKEIAAYMSSENSRVAVIQSRQDQVLVRLDVAQAISTSNSDRILVLESSMSALMKIAWATMFAVFAMLAKGLVETYQRSSSNGHTKCPGKTTDGV